MTKTAKLFYREIVIGTGPSTMGYLTGIKTDLSKKNRNILLITRNAINDKGISQHPKLCKDFKSIVDTKRTLGFDVPGATSAHGGLSNAWGGVLVELSADIIEKLYKCSITDADEIKNFYSKIIDEIKKDKEVNEFVFNACSQKIYVINGCKEYGWENGGLSITSTIDRLADELGIKIQSGLTIDSIFKIDQDFKWMLKGTINNKSTTLYCNHLVLSAGVISNISFHYDKGTIPSILDHTPHQIACLSFSSTKNKNNKTPVVNISADDQHIAVEYRIKKLSKAFLNSFYGVRKGSLVYYLSRIFPISLWQIWTESTNIVISDQDSKTVTSNYWWYDVIKCCFKIIKLKVLPLYVIKTKKGEGFHYISPDFIPEVKGLGDSSIVVLGGAAMKDIPVHHPSLTFMAHAAWIGGNLAKR